MGCAGAVTAGTCVLCYSGTYQTGSGPPCAPPWQQASQGNWALRVFHGGPCGGGDLKRIGKPNGRQSAA